MDNMELNTPNILPLNDHDLLIKLDTKMDALVVNFNSFQTNLITRVARTEARLDTMDLYHAGIPLKEYDSAFHWVEKLRANFYILLTLGTIIITSLGAVIGNLINRLFHF